MDVPILLLRTTIRQRPLTMGLAYMQCVTSPQTTKRLTMLDEGAASVDITSDNQAIYDGAYEDGEASVVCADITSDNQEAYNEGAASVDITSDNQEAYDEGAASVCPGDFSGDGNVNVSDLGGFLGAFGTECSTSALLGCTDSTAYNYDPIS